MVLGAEEPPGWLERDPSGAEIVDPPELDDQPPRARSNGARPTSNGRHAPRVPPQNLDAEAALLGAMLIAPAAVDAAVSRHVTPADFYQPAHGHIYAAIVALHQAHAPADPITVADELDRRGLLDLAGGRRRLLELQGQAPSTTSAAHYAHLVHELAWPRQLITLAGDLQETAYSYTHAPDAVTRVLDQLAEHSTSPTEDDELEEWNPIDLGPALRGELEPVTPQLLQRDDHRGLLYPAQVNGVHGDSGLGKSWVAAIAAAQEMLAGYHVQWINLEDPDAQPTLERLRILGVDDTTIANHLHYHSPNTPFTGEAVELLTTETLANQATLLVVDSIGEAFGLEGLDENQDKDVGPWYRRVARRLAEVGVAVLIIDHATKAADNPLHPSGSKRKRAAITGASYLLEAPTPLTRENGGRLELTCAKDRHGHYRRGEIVAQIDFKYYPDGGLSLKVMAPAPKERNRADQRLQAVARAAVRAAKSRTEPVSKRILLELMKVKAGQNTKIAGIEEAIAAGAITTSPGPRGATLHTYVKDLPKPDEETPDAPTVTDRY